MFLMYSEVGSKLLNGLWNDMSCIFRDDLKEP